MDLEHIQSALKAFEADAGGSFSVNFTVQRDNCYIYFRLADVLATGPSIIEYGNSFLECLNKARAKWAEISGRHATETTKKLALAIIRLTHELGECSDAALRTEFDAAEIEKYGPDAINLANTMADKGPFEIVKSQTANAA